MPAQHVLSYHEYYGDKSIFNNTISHCVKHDGSKWREKHIVIRGAYQYIFRGWEYFEPPWADLSPPPCVALNRAKITPMSNTKFIPIFDLI